MRSFFFKLKIQGLTKNIFQGFSSLQSAKLGKAHYNLQSKVALITASTDG